ncbi:multi-copper polyphenol oxidoreductase [Vibrio sp. 10N.286.49.B3]|uniref:peptidoglycan editing factor PgeF n=1 Tax=Vibrio sp. 10N.286.49.B3 TaxID=1880855 RepID=UPI000C847BFF|nr:peptidoglycan editing factor PgeF [Vibrio sp. 10N.286.49.B3]PMH39714.1 multi-copper polyphenol oxidoreductase [Vibrio sp. 10N.286.49.B3]
MPFIIPNWSLPKHVKAISSTRRGGVSLAPYASLNVGAHVGDKISSVAENREQLMQAATMPSAPVWLNQTHSTRVVEVSHPTEQVLDADGVFTRSTGVVCSAMTADCLPILICDKQGQQVAAVHAGWRGLADGIVENAIEQFSQEVSVWVGPAIGPSAFEVGDDVRQAFMDVDSNAHLAFQSKSNQSEQPNKWLANMPLLVKQRLNCIGVSAITMSDLCTYQDPERFFSYRRDGVTGRQASFIWLED